MRFFEQKKVKITGGAGFLGTALVEQFLKDGAIVSVMSRNEKMQHELKTKFPQVECFIGDVVDAYAVSQFIKGADIVVHAAAVKHIPVAEKQPRLACQTNIIGSINVIEACEKYEVKECICISTDKAADPFNTYGMTKYLMERLFLEAAAKPEVKTLFKIVRYGNVICSSGSVVPYWLSEKKAGRKIKVTDPEMTRFFFTVHDAVDLIMKVLIGGFTGVVYSKKMKAARMGDVAEVIAGSDGYEVIGNRGGEKVHEALFSESESRIVCLRLIYGEELMQLGGNHVGDPDIEQYTSDKVKRFTKEEIKDLIAN